MDSSSSLPARPYRLEVFIGDPVCGAGAISSGPAMIAVSQRLGQDARHERSPSAPPASADARVALPAALLLRPMVLDCAASGS
jgi:hypothetical protein